MSESDQNQQVTQSEMPFAVVEGQPFTEMPTDLYIPPDALEVILEAFEGPLDLLLYLIKRQNLDILNIPIFSITRQYVEYIELGKSFNSDSKLLSTDPPPIIMFFISENLLFSIVVERVL